MSTRRQQLQNRRPPLGSPPSCECSYKSNCFAFEEEAPPQPSTNQQQGMRTAFTRRTTLYTETPPTPRRFHVFDVPRRPPPCRCSPIPQAPGKALAHALLLWLYPVSFFFSFLFYTDPGATFFVLLCYLLATGRSRGGGWGRRLGSSLVRRAWLGDLVAWNFFFAGLFLR